MQDRINKEKEFHNYVYDQETEGSRERFYTVTLLVNNYYKGKLFEACKGKRVLEFGCGLGNLSFQLSEFAENVNSIDISDVAIEKAAKIAAEKGINNISFSVMNAESLKFPDNCFDIVCGKSILHHLDLKLSYSEIARVLKPDGKAYFVEPLGHNPLINIYRKLTPGIRTEDEHPFRRKDMSLIINYFNRLNLKFFYFLSLLSVLFNNKKSFFNVLNFLNSIDQMLFKKSFLKYQAWQVVIEMENPRKL